MMSLRKNGDKKGDKPLKLDMSFEDAVPAAFEYSQEKEE
jgi:hypothetical protein